MNNNRFFSITLYLWVILFMIASITKMYGMPGGKPLVPSAIIARRKKKPHIHPSSQQSNRVAKKASKKMLPKTNIAQLKDND